MVAIRVAAIRVVVTGIGIVVRREGAAARVVGRSCILETLRWKQGRRIWRKCLTGALFADAMHDVTVLCIRFGPISRVELKIPARPPGMTT